MLSWSLLHGVVLVVFITLAVGDEFLETETSLGGSSADILGLRIECHHC